MRPLLVLAILGAFLVGAGSAVAGTWNVPADAPTIQAALDSADVHSGRDTVLVASGTYYESDLSVPMDVALVGATGNPDDVILDGEGNGPILMVGEVEGVEIRNLTLRNGHAPGPPPVDAGGLLLILDADPLVENCVFTAGSADQSGGAVASVSSSNPTFRRCAFHDNLAFVGGGAMCLRSAGAILDSCAFESNFANGKGGAVFGDHSQLTIRNGCSFSNNDVWNDGGAVGGDTCTFDVSGALFTLNHATNRGGAIYADGCDGSIRSCDFTSNTGGSDGEGGGAICLLRSYLTIDKSQFVGNTSESAAGAMLVQAQTVEVDSCAFTGNQASHGAAVVIEGDGLDPSPQFTRCVFSNNSSLNGAGAVLVRSVASPWFGACTFSENTSGPVDPGTIRCGDGCSVTLERCIIAFSQSGLPVSCDETGSAFVSCTDVFGNADGDWVGCLSDQDSVNGNFSADPLFCSGSTPDRPYALQGTSPCANDTCGLIGADTAGCAFLKDWSGLGDGESWEDPDNWAPSGTPGPDDDVRLTKDGTHDVTLSSPATVYRLVVGSAASATTLHVVSDTLKTRYGGENRGAGGVISLEEGGTLRVAAGASFVNQPGATVWLRPGSLAGDGSFLNTGYVDVTSELPGTSRISVPFTNAASPPVPTVDVSDGILVIDKAFSNLSLFRCLEGADVRLDPGDGPLRTDIVTNSGYVLVDSGATLTITGPNTVFRNIDPGEVELRGGHVLGTGSFDNYGDVRKTNPPSHSATTSRVGVSFDNLVDDPGDGAVRVEEGVLAIEDVFETAGSLYVHTSAAMLLDPGDGPLRIDLLTNTGVLIIEDGSVFTIQEPPTVFLNQVTGEVRLQGTGAILGTGLSRNYGLFVKEDVTKSRAIGHVATRFENVGDDPGDGALHVQSGVLWMEGEVTNSGRILVHAGAEMSLDPGDGPLRAEGVAANLVGGDWEVAGMLAIDAEASLTNYGVVAIDSGASLVNDGFFDLRENGALAGRGTFDNVGGSFTGAGVVRPGGSAGILSFLGNFSQTATGEIEVEIGGTAPGAGYDRLAITGTAALNGALYTTLVNGFSPVEGDSFAVITIGGGLLGRTDFDCFSGLDVPGSLYLEPVQAPTAFSLVARDSTVSNAPPVGSDDADSTDAAAPIMVHVLANDTDPEMSALRVALISTAGTSGVVAILPGDTLVRYTPSRAFTGRDSFTYTATDCGGGMDVATVTIGVARAPRVWLVPVDAPTIAAGLDSAWTKDTIVVVSGTYHEHNLVMKSGVVLRSETADPANVVIDADSLGPVLQIYSCDSTTAVMGITFTGGNGTGVVCMNSSVTIDRCAFTGNANDLYGGGISLTSGRPVVRRCLFEGNRAQYGGAMLVSGAGSTALIESTLVVNNWAAYGGAAVIAWAGAHPTFRSCTIVGNTCPAGTAGFFVEGPAPTVVQIQNSILASNTSGPSSMVTWCSLYGSVVISCTDVYGNSGDDWGGCLAGQQGVNGNFSADPRFCQFGKPGDPFAIMSGSPCAPENNPSCGLVGARPAGCGAVTAVEEAAPPAVAYRLFANRPNPFNPTTTLRFALPHAERATLVVFDVAGRRVATIADGVFGPGEFDATWNGTDEAGRNMASGIYFARLTAGEFVAVRKMVLLR